MSNLNAVQSFTNTGVTATIVGCIIIFGWVFDIAIFKSLIPNAGIMKVNTAACFVLARIALWRSKGEEERVNGKGKGETVRENRAFASSTPSTPPYSLSEIFIAALFISFQALVGYVYGVKIFDRFNVYTMSMGIHTALTFGVLYLGIFYSQPHHGLMATVNSEMNGGIIARRLIPTAIFLPLVLGWLVIQGQKAGYYDFAFAISLMTITLSAVFSIVIWRNVVYLNQIDKKRQCVEIALGESEMNFRSLAETIDDVFWISEPRLQRLVYVNPAYESIWGRSVDLHLNFSEWIDSIHPKDKERVQTAFENIYNGTYDEEYRVVHPDGTIRWVRDRGFPIIDSNGQIGERCCGIVSDITARKLADEAFQEREEMLRLALELSNAGVYDWDAASNKVKWSPEYYRLFGIDGSVEPSYTTWIESVHPDDRERVQGEVQTMLEQHGDLDLIYRIAHPTAGERWINGRGKAYYNEHGEAVRILGLCLDTTQRKQAEIALQESEQRDRALIDFAPDAIFITTIDGTYTKVNTKASELLGYTQTELTNLLSSLTQSKEPSVSPSPTNNPITPSTASSVAYPHPIAPTDIPRFHSTRSSVLAGNIHTDEWTLIRKDGTPILLEISAKLVSGNTFLIFGRDITARKQQENELRQNLAILNTINQTTPTLIYLKDRQSRMLMANPATLNAIGKSSAEVIGFTDAEFFIKPEVGSAIVENDRVVIESAKIDTFEETVELNNETRIYLSTKSPYYDNDGNIIGIIGISVDITDRKRIQEQLAESEYRYRELVENIPQLVWLSSPDGSVEYFNQRWINYTGIELEKTLGWDWQQVVHPDDQPEAAEKWTNALASGNPMQDVQYRLKCHDGNYRWYLAKAVPTSDTQGNITGWLGTCTEIDDRIKAEEALRQKEQRLRLFVESDAIGIVFTSFGGKFYEVNDAFLRLIGYTRAEFESDGIDWRNITPPEYLPLDEAGIAEASEKGICTPYEKEYIRKDGSRISILIGYTLVEEEIQGAVAFILDITDRKRAENERDRFFNVSIDMLCMAGFDGYFKRINPAFEKVLGYSQASILNTPIKDFIHPDDREKSISEAEKLAAGGTTFNFENRYRTQDGSYRWLLWNAISSVEEGLLYCIARDITERKEMEEALRQSEAKLRFSMTAAKIGTWDLELQTKTAQRSLRHDQIFGYESLLPDWSYEKLLEHIYPEDREIVVSCFEQTLTNHNDLDFECRVIKVDGEMIWIWVRGSVYLDSNGTPTHILGLVVDVSDRKRAEAEIIELNSTLEERVKQRTAQLEAANKELESFSYSVSHDLRAPLRHITGFVDMLQKRLSKTEIDETSQRYINIIAESTKQAGKLIDDLLAFSRMGRTQMRFNTIDMNLLVQEVRRELTPDTRNREINWHIESLPTVVGDPSMLRLVLRNLLENALKYSKTRQVTEISIGVEAPSKEVVFYIKDNGIGFDMRYVHKLFGVFQRLHSDPQFEGTGVGLANVQRIVHRHGGRVWAESEIENGATFYFSLPKEIEIKIGE